MEITERVRHLLFALHRERVFKIFGWMFLVLVISSLGLYHFEHELPSSDVRSLFDSLWWSIVTITTVGYGDTVPRTIEGRLIAMMTMISGIFFLSIITATIASVFVGKRIKEEKGLETIKAKGHILLCGWNEWADEFLQALTHEIRSRRTKIVLVNELPVEEVDAIKERYGLYEIEHVRGNCVLENVLKRANVQQAETVILLSDTSGGQPLDRADERTILATLAIKGLAPKVRTCAELISPSNRQHLLRAKADEMILRGQNTGSLLASAATSPGIPKVIAHLLSPESENRFWRARIPVRFVGKPVSELVAHFRDAHHAILIGILTEEKGMGIEDILSHDMTAIDEFIKKKFEESQRDFFPEEKGYRITLNPEPDYSIGPRDYAVVIARKRP